MLSIGQRCELRSSDSASGLRASIKRYGEVAFIGRVAGLPDGEWIGVRLDKPLGKSDGCHDGVRYFDCRPLHGAFVRREKVNTVGEFPVFATQAESLAHELEAYRSARDVKKLVEKEERLHNLEPSGDELVSRFWEQFTEKEDYIRKQIGEYSEQRRQPVAVDGAKEIRLDDVVAHVNAMSNDAARASSLFLSPYDIRHTQIIVNKLLELVESTRQLFAPRKRFTFRARAKKAASTESGVDENRPDNNNNNAEADLNKQGSSKDADKQSVLDLDELVFANKQHEVIVIDGGSFGDQDANKRRDLNFSHLTDCTIFVCIETSAIRGDALKNCTIYTGPIYGSLWLEDCHSCEFFVACRQLRVHHSANTAFHLRINSHPIIEDCHQMRFGPYRLRFAGLKEQLEAVGLQKDSGLWAKVNDFKWHKAQQSPNWSLCDPKMALRGIPMQLAQRLSYE